jgi:hypothetical protein
LAPPPAPNRARALVQTARDVLIGHLDRVPAGARDAARRALDGLDARLLIDGLDPSHTADQVLEEVAGRALARGARDEAIALLRALHQQRSAVLGAGHPDAARAARRLQEALTLEVVVDPRPAEVRHRA